MSTKRESNYRFAPQLKALRLEKGLNQQEFALDFAKFIKRDAPFSFTTISAWEVGRKTPSLKVLNYLSAYFGVSTDYILGLTSKRDGKGESFTLDRKTAEERDALFDDIILTIDKKDYEKYDKSPVYVSFKNMETRDTWGIMDYENKRIMTLNGYIALGEYEIVLKAYPTPNEAFYNFWDIHSYSLQTLMKANVFWVEIYSSDDEMRARYRGWYQHTPDRKGIINCNNGLILPYTGLNVSYCAYRSVRGEE